MVDVNSAR